MNLRSSQTKSVTRKNLASRRRRAVRLCVVCVISALLQSGREAGGQHRSESRDSGQDVFLEHGVSTTFSVVASDPEAGVCGAVVASKFPGVGKLVIHARGGVGAFCTQWGHVPAWGKLALDLLAKCTPPESVLVDVLGEDKPELREFRQLGIIDMQGRVAVHNPSKVEPNFYWGAVSGRFYTCQGALVAGRKVIFESAQAYEETEGSLADRLMAALLAGDCTGGDQRGRHSAGLRIAKEGNDGYWLELHVEGSDDAVIELAKKYAELKHDAKGNWPGGQLPFKHPCLDRRDADVSGDGQPTREADGDPQD